MEAVTFLAPAHNPPYVAAMRSFRRVLPRTPLVALFETAFFDRLRDAATTYAVPYEWREAFRYSPVRVPRRQPPRRVRARAGGDGAPVRHISCHLGGSSSVAAIRDGVAVDTSFGMSPQSGLPQNNRCGDLDVVRVAVRHEEARPRPGRDGQASSGPVGPRGHQRASRRHPRPRRGRRVGQRPRAPGPRRVRALDPPLPGRVPRRAWRHRRPHVLGRHRREAARTSARACARASATSASSSTRISTRAPRGIARTCSRRLAGGHPHRARGRGADRGARDGRLLARRAAAREATHGR